MAGIPVISSLLMEGSGPPPPQASNAQVAVMLIGILTHTICAGSPGRHNATIRDNKPFDPHVNWLRGEWDAAGRKGSSWMVHDVMVRPLHLCRNIKAHISGRSSAPGVKGRTPPVNKSLRASRLDHDSRLDHYLQSRLFNGPWNVVQCPVDPMTAAASCELMHEDSA
eukprot:357663-Chlamydomonas_euryale.AAC.13